VALEQQEQRSKVAFPERMEIGQGRQLARLEAGEHRWLGIIRAGENSEDVA
jgi:hypothetical protein